MTRPNILLIIADHLSPRAVGAYGEGLGSTPNTDALAAEGQIFGRAYANCPLCQPSRASFWTGLLPHQTKVRSNGRKHQNGPLPAKLQTMGDLFSGAGYKTVHFGKQHDFGTLRGFECFAVGEKASAEAPHPAWPENYDTLRDNNTIEQSTQWLANPPDQPFFAVADFHNPHNICGWVGHHNSLEGPVQPLPVPGDLPPLPDNFAIDDLENRPLPVQYLCCSHNRLAQASGWDPNTYRHYLAAYCHYTRLADQGIGRLLSALNSTPAGAHTLVVVMGDHGDGLASHRMVTKQVSFYDATNRVPFIVAGPDIPPIAGIRQDPLISLVDLLPSLADYAGLAVPPGLAGSSLAPVWRGEAGLERQYIVGEWHTEWGFTISPGRMLRTERYKYIRYLEGNGEELYDMDQDPGESKNLAPDPDLADTINQHRTLLQQHIDLTNDDFEQLAVEVDSRWRSHPCGYAHHRGPSAPMAG